MKLKLFLTIIFVSTYIISIGQNSAFFYDVKAVSNIKRKMNVSSTETDTYTAIDKHNKSVFVDFEIWISKKEVEAQYCNSSEFRNDKIGIMYQSQSNSEKLNLEINSWYRHKKLQFDASSSCIRLSSIPDLDKLREKFYHEFIRIKNKDVLKAKNRMPTRTTVRPSSSNTPIFQFELFVRIKNQDICELKKLVIDTDFFGRLDLNLNNYVVASSNDYENPSINYRLRSTAHYPNSYPSKTTFVDLVGLEVVSANSENLGEGSCKTTKVISELKTIILKYVN